MNIYKEIDVIDHFEERHGNREAVIRACDFMVAYLASMSKPLPELGMRGLHTAMKYRDGLSVLSDLENDRKSITTFLKERKAGFDPAIPEYRILRAIEAVLMSYEEPTWEGGASELVSNFLDLTEKVESDHALLRRLLQEKFSL